MAIIPAGNFQLKAETTERPSPGAGNLTIRQIKYFSFSKHNENEYYRSGSPNKVIPATLSAKERGHVYKVEYRTSTVRLTCEHRIFDTEAAALVEGLTSFRNGNNAMVSKFTGEDVHKTQAIDHIFLLSYADYYIFYKALLAIGGEIVDSQHMELYLAHCVNVAPTDWVGLRQYAKELIQVIDATPASAGKEMWSELNSAMQDVLLTWESYEAKKGDDTRKSLGPAFLAGMDAVFSAKVPSEGADSTPDTEDGTLAETDKLSKKRVRYYVSLAQARHHLYSVGLVPQEHTGRDLPTELRRLSEAFPLLSKMKADGNSRLSMTSDEGDVITLTSLDSTVAVYLELGEAKRNSLFIGGGPTVKKGRMGDL